MHLVFKFVLNPHIVKVNSTTFLYSFPVKSVIHEALKSKIQNSKIHEALYIMYEAELQFGIFPLILFWQMSPPAPNLCLRLKILKELS